MNCDHVKIFILIIFLLIHFVFIKTTDAKNFYLKSDLSIYKKYNDLSYKVSENQVSNITNNYGIGLGAYLSDYIAMEMTIDQMAYFTYSLLMNTSCSDINTSHRFFALAHPMYKVDGTFEEFEPDTSKIFIINPKNPSQYPRKLGVSHINALYSDISILDKSALNDLDIVFTNIKIQTFITSFKFTIPTTKMLIPFFILGSGISKMNIDTNEGDGHQENKVIHKPALLSQTSFAYRIGVGVQMKLSERINIELSTRYFNYGQYKLSNGGHKDIEGADFLVGIIIEF